MKLSSINSLIISLCSFLVCCSCSAKDIIRPGEFIHDGISYLESPGEKFRFGFFPHTNTDLKRYVGIWYTNDPKTVVWVANRDNPVLGATGFVTVADDGNAKVLNKDETHVYFSTNIDVVAAEGTAITALKLTDTGNAVLIDLVSGMILWQSFENPTDTFLPGMFMGKNMKLTSWKSVKDPGSGRFKFQQDQEKNQFFVLNGSASYL